MSEDLLKKLDTALTRIATLEAETSRYRQQTPTGIDPKALLGNTVATLQAHGVPIDHLTKLLVAHTLGDNAPPELKVLGQMGPMVGATQALQGEVSQLKQALAAMTSLEKAKAVRESFKKLAGDKTKYPNLAKAFESDPSYFDEEITDGADAEGFATKMESRLAKILKVAPPASEANADTAAQSMQSKPAIAGAMSGDAPPLPRDKQGVFTQEDHQKLRDEIVRKYSSQT